jgi:hypothetical protein
MRIGRRQLIYYTGASGIVLATNGLAQSSSNTNPPRPPALDLARVKDFVIAGHGNLETTRAMLDEEPGLLNAEWDWGGGDWEMAIGGAGHMGRADIAEFLIARGARLDIFVAAMLGKLEIVKAMIAAYPGLAQSKGPHGIPLLAHAEKDGERAKLVLDYLKSL